ncbi:MAG: ankyrin repeat domain-containing protein [Bacteroidota bacterium]
MDQALLTAIRTGKISQVRQQIKNGAAMDELNEDGYAALHEAVLEGQTEILASLIQLGAAPSLLDAFGNTPLHLACICGEMEMVQSLVKAGAHIDQTSSMKTWTPLMVALNHRRSSIAYWLLEEGADMNFIESAEGWTPLLVSCEQNLTGLSITLIRRGADVHHRLTGGDSLGKSALELISYYGNVEVAKCLIEHGIDLNLSPKGLSAVHWAVYNVHEDLLYCLVEHGADINVRAPGIYLNRTPLHYAVAFNQPDLTRFLLSRGADPSIPDDDGRSPMQLAVEGYLRSGNREASGQVVNLLRNFGR